MSTYRLSLHTGPLKAERKGVARMLKRARLKVITTGTERVYVDVKASDCEDAKLRVEQALQAKGLRRLSLRASSMTCQRRAR